MKHLRYIFTSFIFIIFCALQIVAQDKPNIVYILVDDLGYGDINLNLSELNCFRNPFIKTPNLSKLAEASMVFTNHYAASPVCSPSRAGLLTGRNPMRCNITSWIEDKVNEDSDKPRELLLDEEITIAEICKQAGYQTAIFGKWHLNGADWEKEENWTAQHGSFPNQQGFDYGMVSKENPHITRELHVNSQKFPGDYFMLNGQPVGTIKGYSSEILTDSATTWLSRIRDKNTPFFLYLPYDAVHERIVNPDFFDNIYNTGDPNKDSYYANVTYLDYQIGRFLEGLDSLGLTKNTIVFFSSDNGPAVLNAYFGNLRSYGTSYPLYGQKRQVLEGGIRVPGMVRWPDKIKPGISHEPNTTMDVLPTICTLLNQKIPDDRAIDGANILGHLLKRTSIKREKSIYWQYENTGSWPTIGEDYNRRFEGASLKKNKTNKRYNVSVRSGNYVLRGIQDETFMLPVEFELFDLVNDREEKNELSLLKPEIYNILKAELIEQHNDINYERIRTAKKVELLD